MELFKKTTHIDFMRWRRPAASASAALVLLSLIAFFVRGFNLAVDFTGGTLIEVGFEHPVDLASIREHLASSGFVGGTVQHFGSTRELLIRVTPHTSGEQESASMLSNRIVSALAQTTAGKVEVRRVDFVGPQVGKELGETGGLAVLAALGGILIYVAMRFQWRFAVASVIALAHDAIITVGCFSLFALEFDLTVLAAVLAVIGYSLNDTIVVFDRIRENFRRLRKTPPAEVMNVSINETLSRTLMTSGTTLLVLIALILAGGPALFGFSLALIIGIVVGTYSSIYIASPVALALGVSRADLLVPAPPEEGQERPPLRTVRRR